MKKLKILDISRYLLKCVETYCFAMNINRFRERSEYISIKCLLFLISTFCFLTFINPAFAQAPSSLPLGENFGLGDITSLGEGTSRIMGLIFSVATLLVIIYFLMAAFKYMKAGANKEDIEVA